MKKDDTIKVDDWSQRGYDRFMKRPGVEADPKGYIPGADFDIRLDEMMFNRMIQFKNIDKQPQGNDVGKTYFDPVTKKLYIWVDKVGKWGEILYSTTSTSTTTT